MLQKIRPHGLWIPRPCGPNFKVDCNDFFFISKEPGIEMQLEHCYVKIKVYTNECLGVYYAPCPMESKFNICSDRQ